MKLLQEKIINVGSKRVGPQNKTKKHSKMLLFEQLTKITEEGNNETMIEYVLTLLEWQSS